MIVNVVLLLSVRRVLDQRAQGSLTYFLAALWLFRFQHKYTARFRGVDIFDRL